MERSNKNTRTKCNGISITHNTRARQLGEGWSKPGAGVETRGSKLVFYRGRNFSPELHRQHHTAGMPTGRGGRGAGTRTRERQGRGNARTRTGANLGCQESTSRLQGSATHGARKKSTCSKKRNGCSGVHGCRTRHPKAFRGKAYWEDCRRNNANRPDICVVSKPAESHIRTTFKVQKVF